jgi:glutamate N-acetyltransferase / amino-acid N-acetyltransferase
VNTKIELIDSGSVTSPDGFNAGAIFSGIKNKPNSKYDLGILFSKVPCNTAAVFTTNQIKAAPVLLSQERLKLGKAMAVVANSGCANACTGERGMADARETTRLVAEHLGIAPDDVLVASTGVIGKTLPMDMIKASIPSISIIPNGGHLFTQAIMTTDRVVKEIAVRVHAGSNKFTIGGAAKGAGMIHPDMATMLCFLTTDAEVDIEFLRKALIKAVDVSFNMISVDGDTSTNDMVLLMSNGQAENDPINDDDKQAKPFQEALTKVCIFLARQIAFDGEGATKLIEVTVNGASTTADARRAARTITTSPLVKTAIYGNDPNWGRVIAALGRSGITVNENLLNLYIGNICVFKTGKPQNFNLEKAAMALKKKEIPIEIQLNGGEASATAWGCDLTEEYVKINAEYTT